MGRKHKLYNLALPRYLEKSHKVCVFLIANYESKKIIMKKIGLAMISWKTVKYDKIRI